MRPNKQSHARNALLVGVTALASCVPAEPKTPIARPQSPTDLRAVASTATPQVFEGSPVTLTVTATGGTPPYLFRWDQNAGPQEVALTDATSETLRLEPLTTPGRYVFRAVTVDAMSVTSRDFVTVEVLPALAASAPPLAVAGTPIALTATVELDGTIGSPLWEIVRGSGAFDDPTATEPMLTTTSDETVVVQVSVKLPSPAADPVLSSRTLEIASVTDLRPQVLIETNMGDITLELEGQAAPRHTANFLLYVDDGFYDGLLFHRNACTEDPATGECEPFVLQGGGFARVDGELKPVEPTRGPVESEAGNGLTNGTIYSVALAQLGNDPDSGAAEFFINLADNSFLDDRGFTVFAMVVDGTNVVDAIAAGERTDSPIIPSEVSLPVEDVIMERVSRIER